MRLIRHRFRPLTARRVYCICGYPKSNQWHQGFTNEEDAEFSLLRRSVPERERREMGRAVRAAEAATAAETGPRDPARAGPRPVAQAAEGVRDALAGFF